MKTIVKVLFAVLFVVLMSTPALTQSIRLEAEDGVLMSGSTDIYNFSAEYQFGANGFWYGFWGTFLDAPANFSVLHTEDTEVLLGYNIDVAAGTYSVNVFYNTPAAPNTAGLTLVFDAGTANEQTVREVLPTVEPGGLLVGGFEKITLATSVTLTNGAHAVNVAMSSVGGGRNWILDYVELERDFSVDIANLQAQIDAILGNYGQAKKAYREQ